MTTERFWGWFQLFMLALFLSTFFGRTVYLKLRRNVNPITLGNKKGGFRQVVELAFPLWLILWVVETIRASTTGSFRILPPVFDTLLLNWLPARLIGAGLILGGFAIFVAALHAMGDSWRVGVDEKQQGDLVTRGIFAYSRNPIFVFLNLYAIGSFLVYGTLVFLLFALVLALALHYQILQEEKFLTRAYGAAYANYAARTPRYFPTAVRPSRQPSSERRDAEDESRR